MCPGSTFQVTSAVLPCEARKLRPDCCPSLCLLLAQNGHDKEWKLTPSGVIEIDTNEEDVKPQMELEPGNGKLTARPFPAAEDMHVKKVEPECQKKDSGNEGNIERIKQAAGVYLVTF